MRFHLRLIILLSSVTLLLLTLAAFLLHRTTSSSVSSSASLSYTVGTVYVSIEARNDVLIRHLLSLVEDPEPTQQQNGTGVVGGGGVMGGTVNGRRVPTLTFNIALALAVSMLSMALLITGICC